MSTKIAIVAFFAVFAIIFGTIGTILYNCDAPKVASNLPTLTTIRKSLGIELDSDHCQPGYYWTDDYSYDEGLGSVKKWHCHMTTETRSKFDVELMQSIGR